MKTLYLIINDILDRVGTMFGGRRDWWCVFLARLPNSWQERRQLTLRTWMIVEHELNLLMRSVTDLARTPEARRRVAEEALSSQGLSLLTRPEFEIELPEPAQSGIQSFIFPSVLKLQYRIRPGSPTLALLWGGAFRAWPIAPETVERTSPPRDLVREVCSEWDGIRTGRLVHVQISWVQEFDDIDPRDRKMWHSDSLLLPATDVHLWRERWRGPEQCVYSVVTTKWGKTPVKNDIRPESEAWQAAHDLLARTLRDGDSAR